MLPFYLALASPLPTRFGRYLLKFLLELDGLLQLELQFQPFPDLTLSLLSLSQKLLHPYSFARCKLGSTRVPSYL